MFDRAFQCFKDMECCEGIIESCGCQTTAEGGIPIDETHAMIPDGGGDTRTAAIASIAPYFSKLYEQSVETLLTPDYSPRQKDSTRKLEDKLPSDFKEKLQEIFTFCSHLFIHTYKFHADELTPGQTATMDIGFVNLYYFAIRWGSHDPVTKGCDLIPEKDLLLMLPILKAKKPSLPAAAVQLSMKPSDIFRKYMETYALSGAQPALKTGAQTTAADDECVLTCDQNNLEAHHHDLDPESVVSTKASLVSSHKVTGARFSASKATRSMTFRMATVEVDNTARSVSSSSIAIREIQILSPQEIQADWYVCDRSLGSIKFWVMKADPGQFLISKVKFRNVYRICVRDRNTKLMLFSCAHISGSSKKKNFLFQHKIYFGSLTELVGVLQSKGVKSKDDGKVLFLTTAASYADKSNGLEDAVSLRKQKTSDATKRWRRAAAAILDSPPAASSQSTSSVFGFSDADGLGSPPASGGFGFSDTDGLGSQSASGGFGFSDVDGVGSDEADGFGSDDGASKTSQSQVQSRAAMLVKELINTQDLC